MTLVHVAAERNIKNAAVKQLKSLIGYLDIIRSIYNFSRISNGLLTLITTKINRHDGRLLKTIFYHAFWCLFLLIHFKALFFQNSFYLRIIYDFVHLRGIGAVIPLYFLSSYAL